MKISFAKYHGHGNDFILINNLDGHINLSIDQVKKLCHRNFGIGSDGIILIEKGIDCDYSMNFYNPDGSQSLCGNGSRCALHFARSLGLVKDSATFLAYDGIHQGRMEGNKAIVSMHDVASIEKESDHFLLNNGSPHYVEMVSDVDTLDVYNKGRGIRYSPRFSHRGVNVNFMEIREGKVRSRIYERGVENETLSSGTGTVAVALCAYLQGVTGKDEITVSTRGGKLEVSFRHEADGRFTSIELKGIVNHVFTGEIDL